MRRHVRFAVFAIAALAVGCAKAPAKESPPTPIAEANIPLMKEGLWDGALTLTGQKTLRCTYCDGGRPVVPPRRGVCSRYEVRRTAGGTIIGDSQCLDSDGVTFLIHSETFGDFNSAFTQNGTMTRIAPGKPRQVVIGHMTFRYVGPCPKAAPHPAARGSAAPAG